jgi:hypothetical protein
MRSSTGRGRGSWRARRLRRWRSIPGVSPAGSAWARRRSCASRRRERRCLLTGGEDARKVGAREAGVGRVRNGGGRDAEVGRSALRRGRVPAGARPSTRGARPADPRCRWDENMGPGPRRYHPGNMEIGPGPVSGIIPGNMGIGEWGLIIATLGRGSLNHVDDRRAPR